MRDLSHHVDRDPKSMGFDDEECRRRRRLFHELITLDVWKVCRAVDIVIMTAHATLVYDYQESPSHPRHVVDNRNAF
jgi:hypothetical protein